MRAIHNGLLLASCLLCLLCCACAGSAAGPGHGVLTRAGGSPPGRNAPPSASPALPAPATLAGPPRKGSYIEADLLKNGAGYDSSLPSANVAANGSELDFSPGFTTSSGLASAAYCIYRFSAPGYDRNPQLRIARSVNPAAYADSWLGLANWSSNRWDWYQDVPNGKLEIADISQYLSAGGELLLAVLETGSSPTTLTTVRLGGPAPGVVLTATPSVGGAPLSVKLDASGSTAGEGSITKYEWDADGNGSFEADSGTTPSFDTLYNSPGEYQPAVRVTNSLGNTATLSTPVSARDYWQHTFGRAKGDFSYCVAADSAGNLYYATGSEQINNAGFFALMLYKVDPAGALVWARRFVGSGSVSPNDITITDDNGLIVCGSFDNSGIQNCFVQRWSEAGDLVWSKQVGDGTVNALHKVLTFGSDIYACGNTFSGGDSDLLLVKLNATGGVSWSRAENLGSQEYSNALALKLDGSNLTGVIVGGYSDQSGFLPWKCEWSPGGTIQSGMKFDNSALDMTVSGIAYDKSGPGGNEVYYLSGSMSVGALKHLYFIAMPASGSSLFGRSFAIDHGQASGMAFGPQQNMLVCGNIANVGTSQGLLASFSLLDGSLLAAENTAPGTEVVIGGMQETGNGLALSGYAKSNSYTWSSYAPASQTVSATWIPALGSGGVPSFTSTDLTGNINDALANIIVDTDDPDYDTLAARRGEP